MTVRLYGARRQVCRTPAALTAAGLEVDEAIVRAALACVLHDPAAPQHRLLAIVDGGWGWAAEDCAPPRV